MQIEMKELREFFSGDSRPVLKLPEDQPLYIRGAVYSWCGLVSSQDGAHAVLKKASYVGTDGRYSQACHDGLENVDSAEVEYVGEISINLSMVVDWVTLRSLPEESK